MSEYQEMGWSRVAIAGRHGLPTSTANSHRHILRNLSPALREIIGAWLVCLAIAAGCFGSLAAAVAARDEGTTALISLDRAATVANATDRPVNADRQRRC